MNDKFRRSRSYREEQAEKENQEESGIRRLKAEMVDSLKLPKDFLLGCAVVTVTGNREAYIENYRGILEYTCERIVLQTKTCKLIIEGKHLVIDYYTNEEMLIVGAIAGFYYQQ